MMSSQDPYTLRLVAILDNMTFRTMAWSLSPSRSCSLVYT